MQSTKAPSGTRLGLTLLFGAAIFASAFLIFLVQPMVGKRIVPWFGGAPGVWTLCLAFYQCALFLGYGYAHLLVSCASPVAQLGIHALLFTLAFAALPVLPSAAWQPQQAGDPSGHILAMLAANVALPFLMLAATGPLLQAWFSRANPGRSPYPLYALSNLGSLLALLAYPFLIEPRATLSASSDGWSLGFALSGAGILACAWLASRPGRDAPHPSVPQNAESETSQVEPGPGGDALRRALWVLLPACAVVLFMGVTNELCRDVASVPFLWVLPLCIYLLTFILCFADERLYPRGLFLGLAALLSMAVVLLGDQSPLSVPGTRNNAPLQNQVGSYLLILFAGCMLLHGELYRLRPRPQSLTAYYLCVSGGGALGGLFVGLLAPRIFAGYDELPLGLAAGSVLVLISWLREPTNAMRGRWRWVCAGVLFLTVPAPLLILALREPSTRGDVVLQERNFYGVLRVFERVGWVPPQREMILRNGTTGHGFQLADPALRSLPTDYYAPLTGVGVAMSMRESGRPQKIGVIGLGIGTLAAYGRPGDRFKFYEIDPDVVRIAKNTDYFSYLSDSDAEIEIIEGDGRLSLETELRGGLAGQYDILVIDAFSSDSIPVHLLTLEAFELYVRHLREGGLLAVHVTSVHLNLPPLVRRLGTTAGLHSQLVSSVASNRYFSRGASWVLLSREPSMLRRLVAFGAAHRKRLGLRHEDIRFPDPSGGALADAPLWTDDYSDLFGVVARKSFF